MIIRPGSILPINYDLWPAKSNQLVMAMVLSCEGQWFNLCPIHCEPQLAGFHDLVVMPKDSSLNMFMVVMGNLAAGFPAAAISPEVFALAESPRIKALNMEKSECDRLHSLVFTAAAPSSPDDSFKVKRGNFIKPGSPLARKVSKLASDWISFNENSWHEEFAGRHLTSEINICGIINELALPLHAHLKEMTPPVHEKPRTSGISSSSFMKRECAGRIGSLGSDYGFDEPELDPVESLRKKLEARLTGSSFDTPTTRSLLNGPLTDLLKLLLKLYPHQT